MYIGDYNDIMKLSDKEVLKLIVDAINESVLIRSRKRFEGSQSYDPTEWSEFYRMSMENIRIIKDEKYACKKFKFTREDYRKLLRRNINDYKNLLLIMNGYDPQHWFSTTRKMD